MTATSDQIHQLVMHCLDFATTMLSKSGEFYPFGATMDAEGTLRPTAVHDDNNVDAHEIFCKLEQLFTQEAQGGNVMAVVSAVNVEIPASCNPELPDGIRINVESQGYSRILYFPYRISKVGFFKKKIELEVRSMIPVVVPPAFFTAAA